jgi:hypothetical protein
MLIWVAALVAAAFVVLLSSSFRRRDGLLELGSVSTRWLAEHRQYEGGG